MTTNNEQLRKEWKEEFEKMLRGITLSEKNIADFWLSKFAAERAELVRRVEEYKDSIHRNKIGNGDYQGGKLGAFDEVIRLLRHTGEDNQTNI